MSKKADSESTPPPADPTWQAAWDTEDNYWFENFTSRPYALGPDFYDRFRPAFRYGFDAAQHHLGRSWDEAESDIRTGWQTYQHRGPNPPRWEEVKDAVRDAWNRVVGTRQAESEERSPPARE